ncbi:VP6 [Tilligerry virus]|uniref:VP6 n=1 Tax=Tilligerry virus TaxID=1170505 RepID=H9ZXR0_9REOV|nr:VP6 [Tilligerry virus]
MTTVLLLAPGDVIRDSARELKDRGIQTKIVDWGDEEKSGERIDDGDSGAAGGRGGKTAEEAKDGVGVESSSKSGGTVDGSGKDGGLEKSGERGLSDAGIQRKDHGSARGSGSETESMERKFLVLSREIADVIRTKFGQEVGVYKGGGFAGQKILFLDSHVLKEIGLGKEAHAQQREAKKELDRWSKANNSRNVGGKQQKKTGRKGKKEADSRNEVEGKVENDESTEQAPNPRVDEGNLIEDVLSYKKLEDLIGKREVKEEKFGAVRSGVRMVSNDSADVKKASAYFTCPTGDTNWKNVAREAAKQDNIMAYVGQSENPKVEFLHLIDHL